VTTAALPASGPFPSGRLNMPANRTPRTLADPSATTAVREKVIRSPLETLSGGLKAKTFVSRTGEMVCVTVPPERVTVKVRDFIAPGFVALTVTLLIKSDRLASIENDPPSTVVPGSPVTVRGAGA